MKFGDMLVTCSVTRESDTVWMQLLLLFELSVQEAVVQPSKLLEEIRHLYHHFPGDYAIMATRIFSGFMLQVLHMEDSGSILNQNAFNIFRVHYGLTIFIVDGELHEVINFYYGFKWSKVQDLLLHDPVDRQ